MTGGANGSRKPERIVYNSSHPNTGRPDGQHIMAKIDVPIMRPLIRLRPGLRQSLIFPDVTADEPVIRIPPERVGTRRERRIQNCEYGMRDDKDEGVKKRPNV